jgi:hypothetical protein
LCRREGLRAPSTHLAPHGDDSSVSALEVTQLELSSEEVVEAYSYERTRHITEESTL